MKITLCDTETFLTLNWRDLCGQLETNRKLSGKKYYSWWYEKAGGFPVCDTGLVHKPSSLHKTLSESIRKDNTVKKYFHPFLISAIFFSCTLISLKTCSSSSWFSFQMMIVLIKKYTCMYVWPYEEKNNCSLNLIIGCALLGSNNWDQAFAITADESFTFLWRPSWLTRTNPLYTTQSDGRVCEQQVPVYCQTTESELLTSNFLRYRSQDSTKWWPVVMPVQGGPECDMLTKSIASVATGCIR